VWGLDLVGPL
jgi:transposase InsO family protein